MAEHKSTLVIDVKGNATAKMKSLDKATKSTEKSATSLGATFAKIGAAAAVLGVGAIAKSVLKAGVAMQQTEIAFGTMLGSMDKGLATIKELNEFANVTPFNNDQVIKSGRILLTAGISAEKLTDHLKAVGDVAAGTNQPLNEMAAIYSKVMNKGKMQAEELNQMSERGVPILQVLADKYGVLKNDILDMGSKGKITSEDMVDAFKIMTSAGGDYADMMKKQSESVGGRWSTLIGTLEMLAITIGTKLLPAMEIVVTMLQSTALWVGNNLPLIKDLAIAIGVVVGGLGAWLLVTNAVTIAQWALNAAMTANPIGIVVALVAALSIALVVLWHKADGFRATLKGMWEGFKVLAKVIGTFVKDTFTPFLEAWQQFKEGNIGGALGSLGKGLFNTSTFLPGLAVEIAKASEGIGSAFMEGRDAELEKSLNKTKELSEGGTAGISTSSVPTSGGVAVAAASSTAGKVQGSKQTHININLNNLVEEFNVTTQNMTEGAAQVKDRMVEALLQVLNESDRLAKV